MINIKNNSTINFYNQKAADFITNTISVDFTEVQDLFLESLPTSGKILDFGCGSGRDSKYFLSKGYQVDASDGSIELCKKAGEFLGIPVKQMLFHELDAVEEYDGIWACASILHVEKNCLPGILQKMSNATKSNGIIYASFKYGDFEGEVNGRYFTYLTEETAGELVKTLPELSCEKMWVTTDVRSERTDERWLNLILKKRNVKLKRESI